MSSAGKEGPQMRSDWLIGLLGAVTVVAIVAIVAIVFGQTVRVRTRGTQMELDTVHEGSGSERPLLKEARP